MVVDKHITLEKEHEQFIEEECLGLSKFVKKQLDAEMERRNYQ